jgi:hypothetical protein
MAQQTRATARDGLVGYVANVVYADTEHEVMVRDIGCGVWDTEAEAIAAVATVLKGVSGDYYWYAYVQPGQWLDDDGLLEWRTDHDAAASYVDVYGTVYRE